MVFLQNITPLSLLWLGYKLFCCGWIALKLRTDIHGLQMMNPNDFGDPLTFPLAPP